MVTRLVCYLRRYWYFALVCTSGLAQSKKAGVLQSAKDDTLWREQVPGLCVCLIFSDGVSCKTHPNKCLNSAFAVNFSPALDRILWRNYGEVSLYVFFSRFGPGCIACIVLRLGFEPTSVHNAEPGNCRRSSPVCRHRLLQQSNSHGHAATGHLGSLPAKRAYGGCIGHQHRCRSMCQRRGRRVFGQSVGHSEGRRPLSLSRADRLRWRMRGLGHGTIDLSLGGLR